MAFDESKHPRDNDGKFTDKASGSLTVGTEKDALEQKKENDKASQNKSVDKNKKQDYNNLVDRINNGERFTYEQLMEMPEVQKFEEVRRIATAKAKNKPPMSDAEVENYSNTFLQGAKNTPKQYRADIVMGLPAAGKSTAVVNRLKKEFGSFEFDNDEIKKLLPGYDELGASYVHEESKSVQNKAFEAFGKDGQYNGANLAIPIVGSTVESVNKWIDNLQKAGYEVHLHNVQISNIESLNRSTARAIKTGRYVPLDVIRDYGDKPQEVFESIKKNNTKGVKISDY